MVTNLPGGAQNVFFLKFNQGREIFEDLSDTFLPWVPEAFHALFSVSVKS